MYVLTIIFSTIAIVSFILFICTGFDMPELLIIGIIALCLAVASDTKETSTSIDTEVVQVVQTETTNSKGGK